MSVTVPVMSHAAACGGLHRAAQSGWLQGVVTGIGLQRPSVYALAVVQPAECQ